MKHTHPEITHPALRHRMAVAILAMGRMAIYRSYHIPQNLSLTHLNRRRAFSEGCQAMAVLEQDLDATQYARYAASLAFREVEPTSNLELIQEQEQD